MAEILLLHLTRPIAAVPLQRARRLHRLRALRRALRAAYGPFAQQHRAWVASFFDDHFLVMHAAPLLLDAWESNRRLTSVQLAAAWRAQFSPTNAFADMRCTEATQVATAFLEMLEVEIDAYPALAASCISA